jgi:very-short-patch-repair endonuclease
MIGYNEPAFFDILKKHTSYSIVRPKKPLFGCYPDGYIEELNLVIEFDEPHHNSPKSIENDKLKDEIYNDHGLKVFRVKQEIWDSDPEKIISEFKSILTSQTSH